MGCSTSSCRRPPRSRSISNLVAAVEDTAAALGIRIIVEGYRPPDDVRLKHFLVTPDPGVIEVNVQPACDWRELDEQTTMLYAEARKAGLTTRSSCSTGGTQAPAAAITSCSAARRPTDSPFLRRPDLLRSLASYWHNHPSLSYLFSGMFLGPTEPGAARRRSASRQRLRARARVRPLRRSRETRAAVAGRSRAPSSCWST
jgi:uncharacterized protein (DUF2126 family)